MYTYMFVLRISTTGTCKICGLDLIYITYFLTTEMTRLQTASTKNGRISHWFWALDTPFVWLFFFLCNYIDIKKLKPWHVIVIVNGIGLPKERTLVQASSVKRDWNRFSWLRIGSSCTAEEIFLGSTTTSSSTTFSPLWRYALAFAFPTNQVKKAEKQREVKTRTKLKVLNVSMLLPSFCSFVCFEANDLVGLNWTGLPAFRGLPRPRTTTGIDRSSNWTSVQARLATVLVYAQLLVSDS